MAPTIYIHLEGSWVSLAPGLWSLTPFIPSRCFNRCSLCLCSSGVLDLPPREPISVEAGPQLSRETLDRTKQQEGIAHERQSLMGGKKDAGL